MSLLWVEVFGGDFFCCHSIDVREPCKFVDYELWGKIHHFQRSSKYFRRLKSVLKFVKRTAHNDNDDDDVIRPSFSTNIHDNGKQFV